jgi:hypothetical protein
MSPDGFNDVVEFVPLTTPNQVPSFLPLVGPLVLWKYLKFLADQPLESSAIQPGITASLTDNV